MKRDGDSAGLRNGLRHGLRNAVPVTVLLLVVAQAAHAQTLQQRTQAATTTATGNPACTSLQKFYWEIGDQNAKLAGGTWGPAPPGAGTLMPVYSASKWVYGAHVFQRRSGVPNGADLSALRMHAGYIPVLRSNFS